MKKLIFFIFIFVFFVGVAKSYATQAYIVDGQVVFKDEFGNPLTPQGWEVNLSTCLVVNIDGVVEIGFENYTDWMSCQTKAGLKKKVRKIRALIDSMSDLPASESRDLRERAGWVRSYYQSLP